MQFVLLCFGITAMNIVRDLKQKQKQRRKDLRVEKKDCIAS